MKGFTDLYPEDESGLEVHFKLQCMAHTHDKQYEKIVIEANQHLRKKPQDLIALKERAKAYFTLGEVEIALAEFQRIEKVDDKDPELFFQIAQLKLTNGQLKDAKEYNEKALLLSRNSKNHKTQKNEETDAFAEAIQQQQQIISQAQRAQEEQRVRNVVSVTTMVLNSGINLFAAHQLVTLQAKSVHQPLTRFCKEVKITPTNRGMQTNFRFFNSGSRGTIYNSTTMQTNSFSTMGKF